MVRCSQFGENDISLELSLSFVLSEELPTPWVLRCSVLTLEELVHSGSLQTSP